MSSNPHQTRRLGQTQAQQLAQRVGNIHLSPNRAAAVIVWLIGAYTTGLAIQQTGVLTETPSMLLGGGLQALLTVLEKPIWSGLRVSWVGACALLFDAFCNFGGVWQFANKLDQTQAWLSINEAMGTQQGVPAVTKVIIAVMFSLFIAASPETLWKEG